MRVRTEPQAVVVRLRKERAICERPRDPPQLQRGTFRFPPPLLDSNFALFASKVEARHLNVSALFLQVGGNETYILLRIASTTVDVNLVRPHRQTRQILQYSRCWFRRITWPRVARPITPPRNWCNPSKHFTVLYCKAPCACCPKGCPSDVQTCWIRLFWPKTAEDFSEERPNSIFRPPSLPSLANVCYETAIGCRFGHDSDEFVPDLLIPQ
mmetsp:Transcript_8604/g.17837  ORF Transcript_8604/g.17837 Transcript_8604/m.17837 type:complete len:212 (-) Transcript_8604:260-895(-)